LALLLRLNIALTPFLRLRVIKPRQPMALE